MNAQLAAALNAEYAAVFAYGPIGARLAEVAGETRAAVGDARAAEAAHRARRDALVPLLAEQGGKPPAAQPAYALPFPVTDAASALRLAIEVEERTAAVWRAALPATTGDQRASALSGLIDCAVRATRWRRRAGVSPATVPFPGRPA